MVVYIDYIFLENLIMDFLLLYGTKNIVKEKTKVSKITLASIVGAGYVCIMCLLKLEIFNYAVCKILLSFVMVYITFTPQKIPIYLKEVFIFYFISIINTGTYLVLVLMVNLNMNSMAVKITIYLFGYLFIYVIQNQVWKMFKTNLKKSELVYDVYLNNGDKYISYKGFIDTGNATKDISTGRAIFYADKKDNLILEGKEKVDIHINTVNGEGNLTGYMFDNVIIQKGEKILFTNVIVCFTDEKIKNNLGCDMILNYETYEELLGGIYI